MTKYLQSGMRRDVCALACATGGATGQKLKSALEDHYDERIQPRTFYGALETLEDTGHLRVETDGIHDRYVLTDAGERVLREHVDWLREQVCGPADDSR